jgi:shikimate kinase
MNIQLKQTPGLYLVGFMGSGKTTVGTLLADRLGWRFADLDADIEDRERTSISEIFETRGEAEFRRIESEMLRERVCAIARGRPTVLALGGGAFVDTANFELVEAHGISIWLDCPFEMVRQRVERERHRPLARDPERFATLFEARREAYSRADYRIPVVSDDPAQAVEAVLALPILK